MRLIARYAKELHNSFEIITVFDGKIEKEEISKSKPEINSITDKYPTAVWFERKMHDDFGIIIKNSFDNRPLIHHEHFPNNIYPLLKSFQEKSLKADKFKEYEWEMIKGDGVFAVAVGPIHAGIIEPGHFHFSQSGERMLHLEVRHFYKNRGIEKMLEGKTLQEAKPIIERISGNESIAYQIALRDIMLQASSTTLPLALKSYHALLLEVERIIHHLTDIGFIPNDAGFGAALAFGSKLSEDARRVMQKLTHSRFGFGAVDFKVICNKTQLVQEWIKALEEDIAFFEEWITDIPSLWDRLDTTGVLSYQNALAYSTVGVVARASGVKLDRRDTNFYKERGFELLTQKRGDVAARFKQRIDEIKNSLKLIKHFLDDIHDESLDIHNIKDGEYFSYVESSIGELFMSIVIKNGVIDRFFARDASFVNWQALHLMMQKDIIADFPLINKSCDLSYAGNDL